MNELPHCIDLKSLAAELESKETSPKLVFAIRSAWRAQSCFGDLVQAEDTARVLRELRKSPRQANSPERATTERALMTTAIILYARATATKGQTGERGSIHLDVSKLMPEQQADHKTIIDLRNQAMAHVYTANPIADEEWHEELIFAKKTPSGIWIPASGSKQVAFHRETLERLERQIPIAAKIVRAQFMKKMEAMTNMIAAFKFTEADALRHRFDPVDKFGGEREARQILQGSDGDSVALWSNRM